MKRASHSLFGLCLSSVFLSIDYWFASERRYKLRSLTSLNSSRVLSKRFEKTEFFSLFEGSQIVLYIIYFWAEVSHAIIPFNFKLRSFFTSLLCSTSLSGAGNSQRRVPKVFYVGLFSVCEYDRTPNIWRPPAVFPTATNWASHDDNGFQHPKWFYHDNFEACSPYHRGI